MKYILFLVFSFSFGITVNGQNTIAKLKYEQAEEAFSKNDFRTTIVKLDEVQKLLGAVNPKIAYLRIMAQSKLIDEDISYLKDLKQNCAYYLKNYDNNPNLEEKYKEVYLVSETLIQYENNVDFDKGYYHDVTTKRYDSALYYYRKAAAAGYGVAMSNIGLLYENGRGVNRDAYEALSWYRKAAEKGISWGLYHMGRAYYHGLGVTQNSNEALNYFLQSASKNNDQGMVGAADTYYYLLKDYSKAFEWYSKAAAKEHDGAIYMLGVSYHNATGVNKDLGKAKEYFEKAALKGNHNSMNFLGWMYRNGSGVPADHIKAIQWYQQAIDKGNTLAMGNLAEMYENGIGVKKDKKKAKELRDKQSGK